MAVYVQLAGADHCSLCNSPFTRQKPPVNLHKIGNVFHRFHEECIQGHLANQENCPDCHLPLAPQRVQAIRAQGQQQERVIRGFRMRLIACCCLFGIGVFAIGMWRISKLAQPEEEGPTPPYPWNPNTP